MFRSRNKNIIYSALFSIFLGSLILNLSGKTLPTAGAFSLSGYNSLNPVKSVVSSYDGDLQASWERIGTENIVIDTKSSSAEYDVDAYHFIVCNGLVGEDGQIIVTDNWEKQIPALTGRWQDLSSKVIRVGIIIDGINMKK